LLALASSEGQETGTIAVKNTCKKFLVVESNLLNSFIHFQLQNNAPVCLQIPSKEKLHRNLGKIIPVALKYLIFTMQNSPRETDGSEVPHGSDW
jgi:hypothetical protein